MTSIRTVVQGLLSIPFLIYMAHAASTEVAAEPNQTTSRAAASKTVKTPLGSLERVERRSECKVVVIELDKPPRREVRRPASGSEIIVLTFAGKCAEQSSCQSDAGLARSLQPLLDPGTSMVRAGGNSFIQDESGTKYEHASLLLVSTSRRELCFEVAAEATELTWVDGELEVPLTPLLKPRPVQKRVTTSSP